MNRKAWLLLVTIFASLHSFSQEADPVALRINNKPVFKSQLEKAYKQANKAASENKKAGLNEFVQSYINFKLSVEEAKELQLDTTASYRHDLSTARVEAAKKYNNDIALENKYIQKIYDRKLEDIELNHVLIPFDKETVLPSDTLALYKKAISTREEIIKHGFKKYNTPGTSVLLNAESRNGYIGWVTAFMLSPRVEDVAYTISLKEISMPIRTAKGYHIIQVLAMRPTIGIAEVDQVVFGFPTIPPTQHEIDSVSKVVNREYAKIKTSSDYQALCDAFSRVHKTGEKGCKFGFITLDSQLPPDFINAVFNLKHPGEISKPILTDYGYHIIRLANKLSIPQLGSIHKQLRNQILNSDKLGDLIGYKENALKEEFKNVLYINNKALDKLKDIANTVSPKDSLFFTKVKNGEELLMSIDKNHNYYVKDFIKYIRFNLNPNLQNDEFATIQAINAVQYSLSTDILNSEFGNFMYKVLSNYAYISLEERHSEYKEVINNFSDQLLSYAAKNTTIWERAQMDEKGLSEYFDINKSKYSLDTVRYKGLILYAQNESDLAQAINLSKMYKNRQELIEQIRNRLNENSIKVQLEFGTWKKGDNPYVDNKVFDGQKPNTKKYYPLFYVDGKFIQTPEDYTDVRAKLELDYQQYLEKEWTSYLRKKYPVEVNKSVIETIK